MGMAVGSGKGGAMAEMNIVPLIDILLVMIIIFMVITPMTPKGLDALVPQPPPPNQPQNQDLLNKTVVVQVNKSGLKINEEPTTWETMGQRLEDIFKTRAEKIAFVKGDDEVHFDQIAKAIDIMRASGIDKVGLMTAKIEAGQ